MRKNIIFGEHEEKTCTQFKALFRDNDYLGLMADGHLGYGVPIGCVMANETRVAPQGVGYDIGCGNTAVRFDLKLGEVDLDKLAQDLQRLIPFGIGSRDCMLDKIAAETELFDSAARADLAQRYEDYELSQLSKLWSLLEAFLPVTQVQAMQAQARRQIGSVGSGNHYVDVFADEADYVWVGVHFGSRGLGHKIATLFMNGIGCVDDMMAEVKYLEEKDLLFQPYVSAVNLVQTYASFGRNLVCDVVAACLGNPAPRTRIENHHNALWVEKHFGKNCYVVRKGSTPNHPGQSSFVGATMLENSYILAGTPQSTSEACLTSTVHGAGRVLGRMAAKGKKKKGVWVKKPLVDRDAMRAAIAASGVRVLGGDVDEFSECYKRLDSVLAAQGDTVIKKHTLRPIMVLMAGQDVRDPYKD